MCNKDVTLFTWKEDEDGSVLIVSVYVRHELLQKIIVDAVLVQPGKVAPGNAAVALVPLRVIVRVQGTCVCLIISPASLHNENISLWTIAVKPLG